MDKYHEDIEKARPYEMKCVKALKRFHNDFSNFKHIDDLKIDWKEAKGDAYDPLAHVWAEVKADYYGPTGNLFIERYSNKQDKIDGGPWQYTKCKWYWYYFVNQNRIIIMSTKQLREYTEKLINEGKCRESTITRDKTGKPWETFGYLVKEEMIKQDIPYLEVTSEYLT